MNDTSEKRNMPGKLYRKMVAVNMLTSLIPLVLFSIFSLYTFNNNYLKLINRQYSDAINRSSAILSYYLDTYYNIVKLNVDKEPRLDISDLGSILSGQTDQETKNIQMKEFLRELSETNPYVINCLFIDGEGSLYGYQKEEGPLFYPDITWELTADEPFLVPLVQTEWFFDHESLVLMIGKRYDTSLVKGTLYVGVDTDALNEVFTDREIYGRGYLRILDSEGRTVYEREQDVDRRAASIAANLRQLIFSKEVPGKGLAISFSIDKVTVMADVYVLRGLMILIILCCVMLVLIVSFRFSRQMTRPISQMMAKMDQLKTGDFSVRLPVESNDEIGILSMHFNDMSRQLELYIEKSYLAQIKEKEAELTALKSQIYPHFLYNTLEVIRMAAFEQEDHKVADMIEALSSQMRYLIGTVEDVVPLKMEIELLSKYIWLINCRYEGKVRFETDADDVQESLIPKMILQPIVENAFFHGLKPKGGQGVIELLAEESEDDLTITIMDNGVGMAKEARAAMEELLSSDRPGNREEYSWQSVGLKNVHDRIRHLYGLAYGLTVVSQEGMGTAISVKIPREGGDSFHVDDDHSR